MAFEIWKESTQFSQFIVLLVFTPMGIVVTALRFVAGSRAVRKPGFEDWMAVVATIFFIMVNVTAFVGK
jgi:threonine/homoserine/homoserine lactone efflux protein